MVRKCILKKKDQPRWRGPGKVIGQDGSVVFIRNGGQYVKAHSCRVQPIEEYTSVSSREEKNMETIEETKKLKIYEAPRVEQNQHDVDIDEENGHADEEPDQTAPNSSIHTGHCYQQENSQMQLQDSLEPQDEQVEIRREIHEGDGVNQRRNQIQLNKLKKGQTIKYLHEGDHYTAEILSRAGKATGIYSSSYNIEYRSPNDIKGKQGYVDLNQVEDVQVQEGTEEVFQIDPAGFSTAKVEELKSWKDNGVYIEVSDENQGTISVKWVCSFQNTDSGLVPKARLVARGFEEPENDVRKESPTCSKDSLRVIMAIIAQKKWSLNTIDIKTAFLQGQTIEREIYLRPPREANTDKLWELRKCVYGLSDASRKWYDQVKEFI